MYKKNWIKRKEASENPSTAVFNLLKILDIPATYSYVDKTLKEHPDFPSLLSIAESLHDFGVRTEGVSGKVNYLTEEDYPSIVHLFDKKIGHHFAVLEGVKGGYATLIHSAYGRKTISLDEFAKTWTGVLLRAIPGKKNGESNYKDHLNAQRMSTLRWLITLFGLPVLFLIAFVFGLAKVGMLGTLIPLGLAKTAGFVLCLVIVTASLGEGKMMNSLCPMGRLLNCHRVIRSPAGRVFGVPIAELGMLYFAGGLLSLIAAFFFGQVRNDLFLIGIFGMLALPYTVFSVIYQAFVIRSWCWICLVIQVIFWLEFYILYDVVIIHFMSGLRAISFPLSMILGFGSITIGWIALRHILILAKKAVTYKTQVTSLRRQPDYIQAQLSKTEATNMGKMQFEVEAGPADARIAITLVVNPLCGYCWEVFNQMDQIIDVGRGQIKAIIRFLVLSEDKTHNATEKLLDREVALRIIAMADQGNREVVHKAIRAWFAREDRFSKRKYDRWVREFPLNINENFDKAINILSQHLEWASNNMIVATPTIFFEDRQLLHGVKLDDLKIFLLRKFAELPKTE